MGLGFSGARLNQSNESSYRESKAWLYGDTARTNTEINLDDSLRGFNESDTHLVESE